MVTFVLISVFVCKVSANPVGLGKPDFNYCTTPALPVTRNTFLWLSHSFHVGSIHSSGDMQKFFAIDILTEECTNNGDKFPVC